LIHSRAGIVNYVSKVRDTASDTATELVSEMLQAGTLLFDCLSGFES